MLQMVVFFVIFLYDFCNVLGVRSVIFYENNLLFLGGYEKLFKKNAVVGNRFVRLCVGGARCR